MNPALARELGAKAPASLAGLEPDAQSRLAAVLATARERQERELAAAVDEGLSFIPRVARIAVKRVLF